MRCISVYGLPLKQYFFSHAEKSHFQFECRNLLLPILFSFFLPLCFFFSFLILRLFRPTLIQLGFIQLIKQLKNDDICGGVIVMLLLEFGPGKAKNDKIAMEIGSRVQTLDFQQQTHPQPSNCSFFDSNSISFSLSTFHVIYMFLLCVPKH